MFKSYTTPTSETIPGSTTISESQEPRRIAERYEGKGRLMGLFSDMFKKMSNIKRDIFAEKRADAERRQLEAKNAQKPIHQEENPNCPFTPDIK
jgi:hypothetical protein